MALSFPLSLGSFFGGLCLSSPKFFLPDVLASSRSAGGEIYTADLGARLWSGTADLVPYPAADLDAIDAKLSILRQSGASFLVSPAEGAAPRKDPGGLILGASSPVIASFPHASREMTISGLPAGYEISAGDFLSFSYGAPARYALHKVVSGAVANGAGVTGAIEVTPPIRPGVGLGVAVKLVEPVCKAQFVPGSYSAPGYAAGNGAGLSFEFIQTLR